MINLHLFDNYGSFVSAYTGSDYDEPWVSYISGAGITKYNKTPEEIMLGTYLTFEIVSGGTLYWHKKYDVTKTIQYRKNEGEWTSVAASSADSGTTICEVEAGDVVEFKGNNSSYGFIYTTVTESNARYTNFLCSDGCLFYAYGNTMSLINGNDFATNYSAFSDNYPFVYLFYNNKGLMLHPDNKLYLPAVNTHVDCYGGMFYGCTGIDDMRQIVIRNNIICPDMFCACSSLEHVDLEPITRIGHNAFRACTALHGEISAPNLTYIGYGAFYGSGIESVTNLGSITVINGDGYGDRTNGCFMACPNLTSITLPSTCVVLGTCAFKNSSALTSVNLENIQVVSGSAIAGIDLGEIYMPSLTAVSYNAGYPLLTNTKILRNLGTITNPIGFRNGSKIECIILPPTVTSLGGDGGTWSSTLAMKHLVLRTNSVLAMPNLWNETSSSAKYYVPLSLLDDYKAASGWSNYQSRFIGFLETNVLPADNTNCDYYFVPSQDTLYKWDNGAFVAVF